MENQSEFVPKTGLDAWQRIEHIVMYAGYAAVGGLARDLGISPEILYQVKRGKRGINPDLGEAIHKKFPEIPLSWLIGGFVSGHAEDRPPEITLNVNIRISIDE